VYVTGVVKFRGSRLDGDRLEALVMIVGVCELRSVPVGSCNVIVIVMIGARLVRSVPPGTFRSIVPMT